MSRRTFDRTLPRKCRGLWIPRGLLDADLSAAEMLLVVEIDSLSTDPKGRGCWAQDDHFAGFLGVHESTLPRMLSSLEERGWLRRQLVRDPQFAGGQRRFMALTERAGSCWASSEDPPEAAPAGAKCAEGVVAKCAEGVVAKCAEGVVAKCAAMSSTTKPSGTTVQEPHVHQAAAANLCTTEAASDEAPAAAAAASQTEEEREREREEQAVVDLLARGGLDETQAREVVCVWGLETCQGWQVEIRHPDSGFKHKSAHDWAVSLYGKFLKRQKAPRPRFASSATASGGYPTGSLTLLPDLLPQIRARTWKSPSPKGSAHFYGHVREAQKDLFSDDEGNKFRGKRFFREHGIEPESVPRP